MPELSSHKFSVEDSDNSHSKGIELDNNQTGDKHFYKEDRDTPAHLSGKLRKDYEDFRSKIRLPISKTKRTMTLLKSHEKIESMWMTPLSQLLKITKEETRPKLWILKVVEKGC